MEKTQKILVKEIIDSEFAVSLDRADLLFNFLKGVLERGEKIELSYDGIDVLLTVFANESIGKLYEYFNPELIDGISLVDVDENTRDTLSRVKKKALESVSKK